MKPKPKLVPAKIEKGINNDSTVETHPSYGMISVSRYSGGNHTMFGSSLSHQSGIAIEISRGERHRCLNQNWYHGTSELIRVEMSEAQFAQMITSLNIGGGVPCTLRWVMGEQMPYCEEVHERKKIEHEFSEKMRKISADVGKLLEKARELQSKPSVNKTDRAEFLKAAEGIELQWKNAIPFIQSQFNEAMDDCVTQAKAEVDAFASQIVRQLGVDALQKKMRENLPSLVIEEGQTPSSSIS